MKKSHRAVYVVEGIKLVPSTTVCFVMPRPFPDS